MIQQTTLGSGPLSRSASRGKGKQPSHQNVLSLAPPAEAAAAALACVVDDVPIFVSAKCAEAVACWSIEERWEPLAPKVTCVKGGAAAWLCRSVVLPSNDAVRRVPSGSGGRSRARLDGACARCGLLGSWSVPLLRR